MTLGTAGPQKGRGVEGEGRVQWGEGEGWHSCQQMSQMPPWGAVRGVPTLPPEDQWPKPLATKMKWKRRAWSAIKSRLSRSGRRGPSRGRQAPAWASWNLSCPHQGPALTTPVWAQCGPREPWGLPGAAVRTAPREGGPQGAGGPRGLGLLQQWVGVQGAWLRGHGSPRAGEERRNQAQKGRARSLQGPVSPPSHLNSPPPVPETQNVREVCRSLLWGQSHRRRER